MIIKLFELRDSMTCISAMAIKLAAGNDKERKLLAWAGLGSGEFDNYVLLCGLGGIDRKITFDQYAWDNRTMAVAHDYIIANFNTLESGDLIDVQFILGETKTPKTTDL